MSRAVESLMIDNSKEEDPLQTSKEVIAVQKRKNPRYAVEFPLGYSLVQGDTIYHGGLTGNASEGGLLVYLPEKIEIGSLLRIEIFYTKNLSFETIGATAKTVWSDLKTKNGLGKHRYGLQFQSIDEGNLLKLKALLTEAAEVQS